MEKDLVVNEKDPNALFAVESAAGPNAPPGPAVEASLS
jgi:hypothetical protein